MAVSEQIATRKTYDGHMIALWSDGDITTSFGFGIKGIGKSRSAYERKKDLEAGWLLMGEVELYDWAEVPALIRAARKAVRQRFVEPLAYLRKAMTDKKLRVGRKGGVVWWEKRS